VRGIILLSVEVDLRADEFQVPLGVPAIIVICLLSQLLMLLVVTRRRRGGGGGGGGLGDQLHVTYRFVAIAELHQENVRKLGQKVFQIPEPVGPPLDHAELRYITAEVVALVPTAPAPALLVERFPLIVIAGSVPITNALHLFFDGENVTLFSRVELAVRRPMTLDTYWWW
jgi:hypothetical protein